MEKAEEIKKAKARRAKLLAEKERTQWTDAKLAKKYKLSSARIWQMLSQARKERVDNELS